MGHTGHNTKSNYDVFVKMLQGVDGGLTDDSHDQKCGMSLRPQHSRVFNDTSKLKLSSHSFNTDAARVWNLAPDEIRTATTLAAVKSKIKKYVTSLPV